MELYNAVVAQEDEIREAVAASQPLVSEREPVTALQLEYAGNPVFSAKLTTFAATHAEVRRVRGDGSCFYRAFLVGLSEWLLRANVTHPAGHADADSFVRAAPPGAQLARAADLPLGADGAQARYEGWLAFARDSLPALTQHGWSEITVSDFRDAFMAYLWAAGRPAASSAPVTPAEALAPLGLGAAEPMESFFVLTYLRCLCALELRGHEADYEPWVAALAPECHSVRQFCDGHVEAVNTDADSLQIMALATSFGVTCNIAYLDATASGAGGDGTGALSVVTIPDGAPSARPTLHLLYRPGHYDVAYLRETA